MKKHEWPCAECGQPLKYAAPGVRKKGGRYMHWWCALAAATKEGS